MKQNFPLHYFYGENENAIRIQIWCTLIVQLQMTVIQKKAQIKKAFSVVASFVRIHLISMLNLNDLLQSNHRDFKKQDDHPPPPITAELVVNFKGSIFLFENECPKNWKYRKNLL